MKDLRDMDGAIAITGLAGRFPGAETLTAFWDAVCEGRDLIQPHAADMLADNFTDAQRASDAYVPIRPAIADADMFDAPFFGMNPREAAQTDPQFRVFLECCWQALEDAAIDPDRAAGPIGVFGGASMSTYFLNNIMTDRARVEDFVSTYQLGDYQQFMGALGDTLATRVAFRLGLTGPAITVATACSTSLVAIAQACQSLSSYQCDSALAGGVSITFPQERGYIYQDGGMVSHDGHCRPFDASASGTVFGHGAGVVVLRRLEDAQADGDRIYAVIRGTGLNNDGADKIAFTAPSVTGQAMAIAQAQGAAGVDPATIGYVECHGTGTPLGDPVEFEGLKQAFAGVDQGRTALGSIKANIGHCDAAAGVIGLIKTTLALHHRVLPMMANYTAPNPMIDLGNSPFHIPTKSSAWVEDGPLRAGVSAMGVGGTNAHVILEQAPSAVLSKDDAVVILPFSAMTDAGVQAQAAALADVLAAPDAPTLTDAGFTLQEGRRAFEYRRAVAAMDTAGAIAALRTTARATKAARDTPPVMFLFPGQGAQYPGMGGSLYRDAPVFAHIIDTGSEILKPLIGLDLAEVLYGDAPKDAARVLQDTAITQPALYLVEYATAMLWQSRGITPAAMIGHSVGEFVAATMAGVMSFETGLTLIAARGRLMQDQQAGGMLSVRASVDDLAGRVPDGIDLAARNAPKLTVYAGANDAIDAFKAQLDADGIACTRLHTSHAFHSAMMDPVVDALQAEAARHSFAAPTVPYVSCVTGTWITDAQATDPAYWAAHCRACVNFEAAIATLCADTPPVLLEVGPGRTLSAFSAQATDRGARVSILQSLPDHSGAQGDGVAFAAAFGGLWAAGVPVDWAAMRHGPAHRASLPTYPFEKARHWVEPPAPLARTTATTIAPLVTTQPETSVPMQNPVESQDRTTKLTSDLFAHLTDLSGDTFSDDDADATFLELGFDSLLLGQLTQKLARSWKITLTFRQLMTEFPSVSALVSHLDAVLPPDVAAVAAEPVAAVTTLSHNIPVATAATTNESSALMQAQTNAMLALFETQMRSLGTSQQAVAPAPAEKPAGRAPVAAPQTDSGAGRHDLNRRAAAQASFTPEQITFVDKLCADYSAAFPTSKARAQQGRRALADPRTAAGFRSDWKELVFPVIADTAKGAYLTDPDGHTFIDLVNGFGQTAFGHAPDFVTQAIAAQMADGFAIGPQTPLAHTVAEKICAMTGHARVTFCNTGSEAVMAAMRLARTVTGRDTIVTFQGDYHGQFDEVLVTGRKSGDPTARPAVAGVPDASVSNMVVLEYGSDSARDWIADNIDEIAAVLIEPVQSRQPDLRPRKFCEDVRRITQDAGVALIFDEIVTGFRVAPGGMQQVWDITPDMATYGKVIGGGMPVGVLAGDARFLDALDGGFWAFGDDSQPEVAPTFFAGTFVRHPLVLAAMSAVLDHINSDGDALYDRVAVRTDNLMNQMNSAMEERGLPRAVIGFSSWMIVNLSAIDPRAALIYPLMRLGGVHVHDGYPWFLTTAHSEADFERVVDVFADALDQLQAVGILADKRVMPLTAPQKEVWMAAQLGDAASGVFIESVSLTLDGALNEPALETALNDVIARHDALRLRFTASGEAAIVMPDVRLSLSPIDMDQAGLDRLIAADACAPFNLTQGPLIRATLVRLATDAHVLVLTTHHIICDGWSTYLMIEDLAALYTAHSSGGSAKLSPSASFAGYARDHANRAPDAKTNAFWAAEFPTLPELPELPLDTPRTQMRSFAGATHTHLIDATLATSLKRAAAREGVTLFAALGGALAAMLGRIAQGGDVVLAVPTAGQTLLADDRLVGHCVNLLPVRMGFNSEAALGDYLKSVAAKTLDCFDHGDTTYGAIVQAADLRGDPMRQPLTEVQFNLDQQPDDFGFSGLKTALAGNPRAHTNFDLIFNITEGPDGLRIDLTYATDVLCEDSVSRWCGHYHTLLAAMADDLNTPLANVPLLTPDEHTALVCHGTPNPSPTPDPARVDAMIAAHIQATPDATAIEDARGAHTYAAIGHASDRLAAELRRQVPEGGRVAVLLDRSATLVVAMLAVMKAGLTYVPLDPNHPPARLRSVIDAADVAAIVNQGAAPDLAGDIPWIDADGPYDAGSGAPSDLPTDAAAYVIFTSGTTGTPKGVEVPHSALATLLSSMAQRPGFTAQDTLLAVTTVAFDIAALELFLPLTVGGKLVIARDDDVREAFPITARLAKGDISVVQATPTFWQMLLEAGLEPDPSLKILIGGEALPRDLADRLRSFGGEVWNMYGPTETTIWSSCAKIDDGDITIGEPTANTIMHVLDAHETLAPIGVVGELNIGGAGLANGYVNQPDLTAAAFRTVDIDGPVRLYRTGDLARRMPDGTIQLLGRRDGQVKLRGFRIELGDIEAAMRAHPQISTAAAQLRDGPAGPMLAGYYVADADAPDLAATLSHVLPAYMVPQRFMRLDALPMTGSGKLDRKALPAIDTAVADRVLTAPVTELETKLLDIWQDVLGTSEIGTTDDLFQLGADSLSIFRIAARSLDRDLGIEARHLMQYPTIKSVAAFASTRTAHAKPPSLKDFRNGAARRTEVAL